MAGEVLILTHLLNHREDQEVSFSAFGSHQVVAPARASLELEENLSFLWLFLDLLLSRSVLKWREFKEGGT
jgi:hypothetical protein